MKKPLLIILIVLLSIHGQTTLSSENAYDYYIDIVNAPESWTYATGKGITVAIIDTGMDIENPVISNNIWINEDEIPNNYIDDDSNGYIDDINGWNVKDGSSNVDTGPQTAHGTEVAGVLYQFAPNVKIMPILFMDETFTAADTVNKLPEAINYAVNNGAKAIIMSFGIQTELSPNTLNAIQVANDKNVTIVAATGNDNSTYIDYPAAYDGVIAVGAVDSELKRSIWSASKGSNYGQKLDLVAAGTGIYVPSYGGQTVRVDGTSFSTPAVAALAALLYELRENATVSEIFGIMKNTVTDLGLAGRDNIYGYGLVNFAKAVKIITDVLSPKLLDSNYKIRVKNSYQATLQYNILITDESGISACKSFIKLASETTFSEGYSCIGIGLINKTTNQMDIVFNLEIKTSLVQLYFQLFDYTDKILDIGTLNDPILIKTSLLDELTQSSTIDSTNIGTSYYSNTENFNYSSSEMNTGGWITRETPKTANFSSLLGISLTIGLIFIRKRKNK